MNNRLIRKNNQILKQSCFIEYTCYFFPVLKYICTVILFRLLMQNLVECYIRQLSNKTNQTKSVLVQSFISTTRF